jgi:hypothetical protein
MILVSSRTSIIGAITCQKYTRICHLTRNDFILGHLRAQVAERRLEQEALASEEWLQDEWDSLFGGPNQHSGEAVRAIHNRNEEHACFFVCKIAALVATCSIKQVVLGA